VIAGIGHTDYSRNSGRSEAHLAVEAVVAAIGDSGIPAHLVDGFVTYTMDSTDEIVLQRNLGLERLNYTGRAPYGGTSLCSTFLQAKLAVESGVAEVVVCYRALNERSGGRFGHGVGHGFGASTFGLSAETDHYGLYLPFGLRNAAGWIAMQARRYMHRYGIASTDLAEVTVAARRFAATNPQARFFQRPVTVADHQASRFVVEPLRLLDCCMESDGGVAVLVTSRARAVEHGADYVDISSIATGSGTRQQLMTSYDRSDARLFDELAVMAENLWSRTDLRPDDVDVAICYDHFTPMVMAQLEGHGFCGPGEAKDFIAGGRIGPGGTLPVNPHGGQLGEAYLHGFNGVVEAVRQLRGTAVNQVENAQVALVSAPPGCPTSGMLLTRR
jgi:acetyl-CoA acetyltransferase